MLDTQAGIVKMQVKRFYELQTRLAGDSNLFMCLFQFILSVLSVLQ